MTKYVNIFNKIYNSVERKTEQFSGVQEGDLNIFCELFFDF